MCKSNAMIEETIENVEPIWKGTEHCKYLRKGQGESLEGQGIYSWFNGKRIILFIGAMLCNGIKRVISLKGLLTLNLNFVNLILKGDYSSFKMTSHTLKCLIWFWLDVFISYNQKATLIKGTWIILNISNLGTWIQLLLTKKNKSTFTASLNYYVFKHFLQFSIF